MSAKIIVEDWRELLGFIKRQEPPDQVAVLTEIVESARPVLKELSKQGFGVPEWVVAGGK